MNAKTLFLLILFAGAGAARAQFGLAVQTNGDLRVHTNFHGPTINMMTNVVVFPSSAVPKIGTNKVATVADTSRTFSGPMTTGGVTATGADTNKFLRGDGSWQSIDAGGINTNTFLRNYGTDNLFNPLESGDYAVTGYGGMNLTIGAGNYPGETTGNGGAFQLRAGDAGDNGGNGGDLTLHAGTAPMGSPGKILLDAQTTTAQRVEAVDFVGNGSLLTGLSFATGTPLYVESDPKWSGASNLYYLKTQADALFATGTPLYVESDPIWSATSNAIASLLSSLQTNVAARLSSNVFNSIIAGYVAKAGDNMTGALNLAGSGNVTANPMLHISNGWMRLTATNFGAQGIDIIPFASGSKTGPYIFFNNTNGNNASLFLDGATNALKLITGGGSSGFLIDQANAKWLNFVTNLNAIGGLSGGISNGQLTLDGSLISSNQVLPVTNGTISGLITFNFSLGGVQAGVQSGPITNNAVSVASTNLEAGMVYHLWGDGSSVAWNTNVFIFPSGSAPTITSGRWNRLTLSNYRQKCAVAKFGESP